ncbi:hypothetical protein PROFUN_09987 [Planoprotostelium fungivorum]|uniref:Pre-rRNA-processing protein Ipi1 N-terminal domain-containing protein n=1 Tax=Planoprotostelium fungivorum TaxID=1890364 RepID=A0A2P6NFM2_9EUKA|nr:hypothetical protein PROFUN_09987 [Planoprotostelium fungivorum]
MANLKKRKKKDANPDFKKKKAKVGQKTPKAASHVDLSFQQKAINMPAQNLSENKSGLKTHRNQTLKDLLPLCKHYNAQVKKGEKGNPRLVTLIDVTSDALNGIRELFEGHVEIILPNLSTVLEITISLLSDEERIVRAALHQLYRCIMDNIDEVSAETFVPLFVVYISSGMTHLSQSIRIDSLAFLNLWIDRFPHIIIRYSEEILPNYVTLLQSKAIPVQMANISTDSNSIADNLKNSTFKSKVAILESLQKVLITWMPQTKGDETAQDTKWNEFSEKQVDSTWRHRMKSSDRLNHKAIFFNSTKSDGVTNTESASEAGKTSLTFMRRLMERLWTILVSIWIEVTPVGDAITATEISNGHLDVMSLVLDLIRYVFPPFNNPSTHTNRIIFIFLEHLLEEKCTKMNAEEGDQLRSDTFASYLPTILDRFTPNFPFQALSDEKRVKETLQNMNTSLTIILSAFSQLREDESRGEGEEPFVWFRPALQHVQHLMEMRERDEEMTSSVTRNMNMMFPVLLKCLKSTDMTQKAKSEVVESLLTYNIQCHVKSSAKEDSTRFIQKNLIQMKKWIESIPKALWELRGDQPHISLLYLRVCAQLGRFSDQFHLLEKPMIPFFMASITKKEEKKEIFGPFLSLPPSVQKKSLELLSHFQHFSSELLHAMIAVSPFLELDSVTFMMENICNASNSIEETQLLSFVLTLAVQNASTPDVKKRGNSSKVPQWDVVERLDALCGSIITRLLSVDRDIFTKLEDSFVDYLEMDNAATDAAVIMMIRRFSMVDRSHQRQLGDELKEKLKKVIVKGLKEGLKEAKTPSELHEKSSLFLQACVSILSSDEKVMGDIVRQMAQCDPNVATMEEPNQQVLLFLFENEEIHQKLRADYSKEMQIIFGKMKKAKTGVTEDDSLASRVRSYRATLLSE